ncbi:TBC1 domain family member 2A-like [Acipenser ruthenus]|uniref:TBC1 domain family member 2A-like n=1 Tax=Acipenser ruthenus TaxID=7906 RepID=UPI002742851C|nr:TBC1 domain family member 2A-like [Acipenser ruthenus]
MVRTVKMEQDCQVGKPMPAADPNLTSPDNHHDLTASAREEVESTKENEGDSTHMDQSNAQEKPVMKTKMEPSSTKLCGYLNKLGGPLMAWKARWFVFEEKKCQLYYYRTSQDVNPLGSIDLANATFVYPAQAQEGTFQIQIPGRVVVLKVCLFKIKAIGNPLICEGT